MEDVNVRKYVQNIINIFEQYFGSNFEINVSSFLLSTKLQYKIEFTVPILKNMNNRIKSFEDALSRLKTYKINDEYLIYFFKIINVYKSIINNFSGESKQGIGINFGYEIHGNKSYIDYLSDDLFSVIIGFINKHDIRSFIETFDYKFKPLDYRKLIQIYLSNSKYGIYDNLYINVGNILNEIELIDNYRYENLYRDTFNTLLNNSISTVYDRNLLIYRIWYYYKLPNMYQIVSKFIKKEGTIDYKDKELEFSIPNLDDNLYQELYIQPEFKLRRIIKFLRSYPISRQDVLDSIYEINNSVIIRKYIEILFDKLELFRLSGTDIDKNWLTNLFNQY